MDEFLKKLRAFEILNLDEFVWELCHKDCDDFYEYEEDGFINIMCCKKSEEKWGAVGRDCNYVDCPRLKEIRG